VLDDKILISCRRGGVVKEGILYLSATLDLWIRVHHWANLTRII